jgi:peptidyl-prolyl cis-trans isomerase SurA
MILSLLRMIRLFMFFAILSPGLLLAQSTTATSKNKTTTLMAFGPGPDSFRVSKGEFEYVYQKNNGGWDKAKKANPQDYREYLNLYIKFRRKVLDAESLGMDTMPAFLTELEGYRKQLAQPYLVEKNILDTLIQEGYQRSLYQVNASHILINVSQDALPQDTLKAWEKIMSIRDSIVKLNQNFGEMAVRHSQDPSAKSNKGDLGYFTAFNMVYPFETAAYNTPVGKVSMPVRTQFGYHIIQVQDKFKGKGIQYASHIIIRVGENYSAKDTASANARIQEIYARLKKGEDFSTLAEQFSDDPGSSKTGGDLGAARLLPEMEDWKRKLNIGEISEPFTTPYGWHILKLTKTDPIPSFEDSKAEIRTRVQKDQRSNLPQEVFMDKLRKEYNPIIVQPTADQFIATLGKEYSQGKFRPDSTRPEFYKLPILELGVAKNRETRSLNDFYTYYRTLRSEFLSGPTIQASVMKNLQGFREAELLKYEEKQLPVKYEDYRELYREYRDGILLFSLTEKQVWKKAIEDSTGLKDFYEKNKALFTAGERIKVREYRSTDSVKILDVQNYLRQGKNEKEIDSLVNDKSALNLRIQSVIMDSKHPDLPTGWLSNAPSEVSGIRKRDKQFVIQQWVEKLPAGVKSFEEARSECITKYQEELESNWNKDLEKRYPVTIQESAFRSLFK